jgi:hypothetical protein
MIMASFGTEPQFAFGAWAFMGGMDDRFGKGYNPFPLEMKEVFEMTANIAQAIKKT